MRSTYKIPVDEIYYRQWVVRSARNMTTSKLHTTTSVSEGKRLQASASYNNVDGILHLVNKKLIFTAKGSKNPMISVPLSDLKRKFSASSRRLW